MKPSTIIQGIILIFLCVFLLSGCGGDGGGPADKPSSSEATPSTPASDDSSPSTPEPDDSVPSALSASFSARFGGDGSETAYSGMETSGRCFILAGVKSASGGGSLAINTKDGYLVKTNGSGEKIWEKYFGGSLDDGLYDLEETPDGGFAAAGYIEILSNGYSKSDTYLMKIDTNGNLLWDKTFDEGSSQEARSIIVTSDGGFLLAGSIVCHNQYSSKMHAIRTDCHGNKIWSNMYGIGTDSSEAYSVAEAADGDFVIAGKAFVGSSSGQYDIAIFKIDRDGNEVWHKTFGGACTDEARCLVRTSDNGFAVAGSIRNDMYESDSTDMVLIKVDSDGNELWTKIYEGTDEGIQANSVQQTADGGFILVGNNPYAVGDYAINLIKTDENGNELWRTIYTGDRGAKGNAVRVTSDGGYVVVGSESSLDWQGYYNSDALIVKTNAGGQME